MGDAKALQAVLEHYPQDLALVLDAIKTNNVRMSGATVQDFERSGAVGPDSDLFEPDTDLSTFFESILGHFPGLGVATLVGAVEAYDTEVCTVGQLRLLADSPHDGSWNSLGSSMARE